MFILKQRNKQLHFPITKVPYSLLFLFNYQLVGIGRISFQKKIFIKSYFCLLKFLDYPFLRLFTLSIT
jgi:hypothetical protein